MTAGNGSMPEAEVSLRVALCFIRSGRTKGTVKVSIDGAHIRTGTTQHFDIFSFLRENGCQKEDNRSGRWQGSYCVDGKEYALEITSKPGEGDVLLKLDSGETLLIEAKKGRGNRAGNPEYPLMREAIGQLVTNSFADENMLLGVAVPYSEKSLELACRWSKLPLIKRCGITFLLVKENGELEFV